MNSKLVLMLIVLAIMPFAYASVSTDSSFTGNFTNTSFNASLNALQITGGYTSGNYISNVIDAGRRSIWNNLSWIQDSAIRLAIVDVKESIYRSIDNGLNWNLIDDKFGDSDNNAIGLSIIDNTFFIVNGKAEVWRSTSYGISWTNIKDDYNNGESNNPQVFTGDSSNMYIFEGDEDVWRSDNSGVNWTKVSDDYDDGNSSANPKGTAIINGDVYVVANDAKVYRSTNNGVNWSLTSDDYNGGDGNSADTMASDLLGNLYIIKGQDVWRSNNSGVNWTKVNDDFNPGDGNAGKAMTSDVNNNLYIADASEDIFRSTDSGVTWELFSSNINGGDGNILGLAAYNLSKLKFQVFSYDNNTEPESFIGPDNSSSTFFTNSSFNELQIPAGRYLKYKVYFETPSIFTTRFLYNVTLSYTEQYNAPNLTINSPANNTVLVINNTTLSISILDQDGDNMTVYFYGDNNLISTQNAPNGSTVTYDWNNIENGTHNWSVIIFDGTYNTSSEISNLFINILPDPTPNVTSEEIDPIIDDDTRKRYEGVQDRRYSLDYLETIAPAPSIESEGNEESTSASLQEQVQQQNEQQVNVENPNTQEVDTGITGSAIADQDSNSNLGLLTMFTLLTAGLIYAYTSGILKKLTPEQKRKREINKLLSSDKNFLEKLKAKIKETLK